MKPDPSLVASLRRVARPGGAPRPAPAQARGPDERCELCGVTIPAEHRHLLHLDDRRIVCTCQMCWSMHSGDPEFRPAGLRTVWLEDFDLPEELWSALAIPIGLTFFLRSGTAGNVVALYPSPAGATESELELSAWDELCARNPVLADLEPDAEALIVNRLADPAQYVIALIDECYRLVGLIKAGWEGISGGGAVEHAVPEFFDDLRSRMTPT